MRKFFVSLILVIIVAGVAFYFGWIQLRLSADSYGVIFTKTNGFEREVIKPGTFVWRWQALIPTNLTLYTYHLAPQQAQVASQGTLPSGALYSQYLEGKPSFAYKITVSISYVLNPTSLPALAMKDQVTPKTLDSWYADFAKRLTAETQNYIASQAGSGTAADGAFGALQPSLEKHLQQTFSDVRFISVTPETVDIPDLALYQRARQQYFAIVTAQAGARQQAAVTKTNLNEAAAQKIELLRKYGALFNEYPVLLKYLDLSPAKRQNVIPGF